MKRRILSSCNRVTRPKTKVVEAAESSTKGQEAFQENLDKLEDDFDFFVAGLEKLATDGVDEANAALQLVLEASSAINGLISKMTSTM